MKHWWSLICYWFQKYLHSEAIQLNLRKCIRNLKQSNLNTTKHIQFSVWSPFDDFTTFSLIHFQKSSESTLSYLDLCEQCHQPNPICFYVRVSISFWQSHFKSWLFCNSLNLWEKITATKCSGFTPYTGAIARSDIAVFLPTTTSRKCSCSLKLVTDPSWNTLSGSSEVECCRP